MWRLLVLTLLASPPQSTKVGQERCVASCLEPYCWYTLEKQCSKRHPVCQDTDVYECKPLVVDIGSWPQFTLPGPKTEAPPVPMPETPQTTSSTGWLTP